MCKPMTCEELSLSGMCQTNDGTGGVARLPSPLKALPPWLLLVVQAGCGIRLPHVHAPRVFSAGLHRLQARQHSRQAGGEDHHHKLWVETDLAHPSTDTVIAQSSDALQADTQATLPKAVSSCDWLCCGAAPGPLA